MDKKDASAGWQNNLAVRTGCGCLFPAAAFISFLMAQSDTFENLDDPESLGRFTAWILWGLFAVWAPYFYFWLRHQGKFWLIKSLAVLISIFVIGVLVANR